MPFKRGLRSKAVKIAILITIVLLVIWRVAQIPLNPDHTGGDSARRQLPRQSPLVIDLDGDGLEFINLNDSNAYFDLNGDGFATRTAWLNSDDGFLTLDKNGDGQINDISELFSSPEESMYQALSVFNTNAEGVIDKHDSCFADLQIWQDKNGDGISQANELRSLYETGIESISLDPPNTKSQKGDAVIAQQGSFVWSAKVGGQAIESTGIAANVLFTNNSTYTRYVGAVEFDQEVTSVSNIKGYGQMPDLHIAMSLDSELKAYMLDVFDNLSAEYLVKNIDDILFRWAGVEDISIDEIDPNHTLNLNTETDTVDFNRAGESFTLQELGLLKKYVGNDSLPLGDGQWQESGEIVTTGGYYREAYDTLTQNLLAKMAVANGILADTMPAVSYNPTTDLLQLPVKNVGEEFAAAMDNIAVQAMGNLVSSLISQNDIAKHWLSLTVLGVIEPNFASYCEEPLKEIIGAVGGQGILNVINNKIEVSWDASRGNDKIITTGNYDDHISTGAGDDMIVTGAGDDTLRGGSGADILDSGEGNDYVDGGSGNDTYIFNRGDGQDIICDKEYEDQTGPGSDKLILGAGIDLSDLSAQLVCTLVVISLTATTLPHIALAIDEKKELSASSPTVTSDTLNAIIEQQRSFKDVHVTAYSLSYRCPNRLKEYLFLCQGR